MAKKKPAESATEIQSSNSDNGKESYDIDPNPIAEILSNIEDERSEPTPIPPPSEPLEKEDSAKGDSQIPQSNSVSEINPQFAGGMLDQKGQLFNPDIHESPARKNANGEWARKRGRKTGAAYPSSNGQGQSQGAIPVEVQQRHECRAAAQSVCLQIFTLATAFGGPEWAPIVKPELGLDEREAMITAWEDYFMVSGIIRMPAWLALTVVMGSYAFPRLMQPKYLERIQALKEWFTGSAQNDEGEYEDRKMAQNTRNP